MSDDRYGLLELLPPLYDWVCSLSLTLTLHCALYGKSRSITITYNHKTHMHKSGGQKSTAHVDETSRDRVGKEAETGLMRPDHCSMEAMAIVLS